MTLRQYVVLDAASRMTGCSQTELGVVTRIDRSTLADVVSKLARKDLLRRTRTEEDQRSYSIHVTPKGKSMLDAMRPVSVGANKRLLALLPKAERDAFMAALAKLADAPLSAYIG
jgi:DNA-binding MarR family transcriptional regulator